MGGPNIHDGDWSFELVTPPVLEPMTLTQAKLQVRLDATFEEEDDFLNDAITAARNYLEQTYDIKIMPQTWEMTLQNFPRADRIRFPFGPIQAITYFKFQDTGLNWQTLTVGRSDAAGAPFDLYTRLARKPAEVMLPFGHVWPAVVLQTADPIRIGLCMGFLSGGSPETMPVPPQIRMAMGLLVDHFYENRSEVEMVLRNERIALGLDNLMSNLGFYRYN